MEAVAHLTASVNTAALDGELLVGTVDNEVESLAVVVSVRVGRAASSVVVLVVLASSVGSSADLRGGVVGAAAGSGRLTALNGAGDSQADKSSERSDRLRTGSAFLLFGYVFRGMLYLEEEHLVNEFTTTNDG
jgi:hypothetical protein